MMMLSDTVQLALLNLRLHKVRSILTSLGVIFGVGSVIAMLSISEGAKRKALEQIESMGIDKILVYSKRPTLGSAGVGGSQTSRVETYGITEVDEKQLKKMDNVDRVTKLRNARSKVMKGLERLDLKLISTDINFLEDSASKIISGRWFSPFDYSNVTPVCVIGSEVKRKMFSIGEKNIIGSNLRVGSDVFKIIGILDNDLGSSFPELGSPNDMILIPMPVADYLYNNYSYENEGGSIKVQIVVYDLLLMKVNDLQYINNTSNRIKNYLDKTHSKVKDWDIIVPLDLLKQREETQNIFTIVMSSIAGISLIVGGIGIMNIMLASVFERRKEIGTRRALGAHKIDILLQFLVETVSLTTIGGGLGVMLGIGISQLITLYAGMPTVYSMWTIIASLLISSLVGVIFGTYPAWQAAQQNPITVLRAE